MKRLISVITTAALALSMFCVSFTSHAAVSVTFHSNNTLCDTESFTKSLSEINGMYEIPDAGNRAVFKGWYYGADDDAQAVDFEHDSFTENTDVYAHWADIGVVAADSSDANKDSTGSYDGFELVGVQKRAGELNSKNGGLRFIGALSNSLLEELDSLSDSTVDGSRVEYGFVAASEYTINKWKNYAASQSVDMSGYQLGYCGTNVNGVDTTAHNINYQVAKNINCTASDYSDSSVTDYGRFNDYRLYTLAVTYENAAEYESADVAVRAYLRYYDANGLLRTFYNDYSGTNTYGGLSTNYYAAGVQDIQVGYYSSVINAKKDAQNNTVAGGTASPSEAVCSMYISGGRAYIKLLKNYDLPSSAQFAGKLELNLNGYAFNAGANYIVSTGEFSMINGTYISSGSSPAFGQFMGSLTKLTNVDFKARNLTLNNSSKQFYGVYVPKDDTVKSIYMTDCGFDISTQASDNYCYSNILFSQQAVIKNCDYNISGAAAVVSHVYNDGSALSIEDSAFTVEQTVEGLSSELFAIQSYNSDSTSIQNSELNISGDYGIVYGVYVMNMLADNTEARYCDIDNLTINMDIDDLTPKSGGSAYVRGIRIGENSVVSINSLDIDIDTKAPADNGVCGMICTENAKARIEDINIDISASEFTTSGSYTTVNAYRLDGIAVSGTSDIAITSAYIKVPIGYNSGGDHNSGISAYDNSVVTLSPDSDSDIYIQGGYAALSNTADAKFYVNGGEYCSQSHGGAYFGGDAEITGGSFHLVNEGPYAPLHGGLYVTRNAVVNISGADIRGYTDGVTSAVRTKSNDGRTDNPQVTIKNSTLYAIYANVYCSAGTVKIYDTVTLSPYAGHKTLVDGTGTIEFCETE